MSDLEWRVEMPRLRPHPESLLARTTVRVLEQDPKVQEKLRAGGRPNFFEVSTASAAAARALSAPVALAMARALGGEFEGAWPTQQEYAAFWEMEERTAQREWARFRAVFGEDADPRDLARAIYDGYERRLRERDYTVLYDVPADLIGAAA